MLRWAIPLLLALPSPVLALGPWEDPIRYLGGRGRPFQAGYFHQTQVDGLGCIWALASSTNAELRVYVDGDWRQVQFPSAPDGASAIRLTAAPDGSVVCLWIVEDPAAATVRLAATRHKGADGPLTEYGGPDQFASPMLKNTELNVHSDALYRASAKADYQGLHAKTALFADSSGHVWVTEHRGVLHRLASPGGEMLRYAITDAEVAGMENVHGLPYVNVPACAEDGQGRIWFCSGPRDRTSYYMRGLIIFDGQEFKRHGSLPGLPSAPITGLFRADADTMWAAAEGEGIFAIDTATLSVSQIPLPEPGAFNAVEMMFGQGEDRYVVASASTPVWQGRRPYNTLWRLRAGAWSKVIDGLDLWVEYVLGTERPFVFHEKGLFIGGGERGLWFAPADGGKARLLDWRYDMPFTTPRALAVLENNVLMVRFEFGRMGTFLVEDVNSPLPEPEDTQCVTTLFPLLRDDAGRYWGVLTDAEDALQCWDGTTWRHYALPPQEGALRALTLDSVGQVWAQRWPRGGTEYLQPPPTGTVAVFDARAETWISYADYEKAAEAEVAEHPWLRIEITASTFRTDRWPWGALRAGLIRETVPELSLRSGHQGAVAFMDSGWLHHFDGTRWTHVRPQQIAHMSGVPDYTLHFTAAPWFDEDGRVHAWVAQKSWGLDARLGWRVDSPQPTITPTPVPVSETRPALPTNAPVEEPDSIVEDTEGWTWLAKDGELYKTGRGLSASFFPEEVATPFSVPQHLVEVTYDAAGNPVLQTTRDWRRGSRYILLQCRVPDTQLEVLMTSLPQSTLQAKATGVEALGFSWRVDDGPWQNTDPSGVIALGRLEPGTHRVEARAFSTRLSLDPESAIAELTIASAETADIETAVALLFDPEYAVRKEALARICAYRADALPILQKMRERADADVGWWIDVAIQTIAKDLEGGE